MNTSPFKVGFFLFSDIYFSTLSFKFFRRVWDVGTLKLCFFGSIHLLGSLGLQTGFWKLSLLNTSPVYFPYSLIWLWTLMWVSCFLNDGGLFILSFPFVFLPCLKNCSVAAEGVLTQADPEFVNFWLNAYLTFWVWRAMIYFSIPWPLTDSKVYLSIKLSLSVIDAALLKQQNDEYLF